MANILTWAFEKIPEWSCKNSIREWLAFGKIVPNFVSDLSPLKGYELHRQLRQADVVVDAGAYPGDYTVFAAERVGPKGKVIAFEPNPENRKILIKNIRARGLNNVIIVPKGLGSEDGAKLQMMMDGLHSTIHSSFEYNEENFIHICTLDAELKRLGIKKIDVIKMDIEGEEVKALLGCEQTLLHNNVYVAIATYHLWPANPIFRTTLPVRQILGQWGYETTVGFEKHLTTYGRKPFNLDVVKLGGKK
jgi:FkbM family methyltransferase